MSGGKTLEDLIKEHKDTDDQQQQPMEVDRHETTEEKKQREARLRAFQARTSNPRTINDAKLKVEKASPYKSSGGTRENMMEGRARALLNKKNQLEESILKKEMQEKKNLEKKRELEEEAKLYRTESQIERANKMIDRLGDPNRNQGVGEDSEEELDQPDPFLELQECISEVLYEEFLDLNQDTHISLIDDDDDIDEDTSKKEDDQDIVKFIFSDLGRVIRAHKHVLISKMPLFKSMLSGNMRESSTRQIEVFDADFEPYFAFVEFIYTGAIKKLDSNHLIELLELSDRFCAEDLRELIAEKLIENLDPGTIKDILEVAHHYKLSTLKQECWRYAKLNRTSMSRYGVFKVLDPQDVEMIKRIDT